MKKKKIAFISPVWEWWPKTLYSDLVKLLNEKYPEYEYFLVSSAMEWVKLHFIMNKYDMIISSVPFFWKPLKSKYILEIHWLYRNDRGITNIWNLLCWFYPYNIFFSDLLVFPSSFLQKYVWSKHSDQEIIYNFSWFNEKYKNNELIQDKEEINLLTIFRADIYDKARWILDLYEKLKLFSPQKKIIYRIAWFWKYYDKMKSNFDITQLSSNIHIEWIWKLDKDWVMDEIKKCDIFLYSTFYETFWIILLEVLSMWKPILLNNYESYYWLYNTEFISINNEEFISKLDKLINNEDYYKEYLMKWFENIKKFDKDTIVYQWYKLINKLF